VLVNSNRQIRRQQLTINSLKRALIDLVLENNDIEKITVSEIASRADLNRGTFYIHYKDKNELLDVLYQDAIEGIRLALRVPYSNMDKVLLEGIVPSTRLIFEHIEKNKRLFKALDLIQRNPDLYVCLEQTFWHIFTNEIQFEREASSSEAEYEIFLSYQLHATLGVIKYWIKKNFKFSADFMCEQLTSSYSHKVTAMFIKEHK
jgi:AcrR family transcriptional regulator